MLGHFFVFLSWFRIAFWILFPYPALPLRIADGRSLNPTHLPASSNEGKILPMWIGLPGGPDNPLPLAAVPEIITEIALLVMSAPTALVFQRYATDAMSHSLGTATFGNASSWLLLIPYDVGYVIHT